MIEIRGDKKVLITPISEEDLADIKIGDIVWLDGDLMTCRDVARTKQFSTLAQSFVKLREQKMTMKWFPLDRQPPCVWRNLSMNLLSLQV